MSGLDEHGIHQRWFPPASASEPAPDVQGLEADVDAYNAAAEPDDHGYDDGYYDPYAADDDGDYYEEPEYLDGTLAGQFAPVNEAARAELEQWEADRAEQADAAFQLELDDVSTQIDRAVETIGQREGLSSPENQSLIRQTADHFFDHVKQQMVADGTWHGLSYEDRIELGRQSIGQAVQAVRDAYITKRGRDVHYRGLPGR